MRVRVLACSTIFVLLGLCVLPALRAQENEWKLKYEVGPHPIKSGTKIAVTVDSENIAYTTGDKKQFLIPVSAVTEVAYDKVVRRGSQRLLPELSNAREGFLLALAAAMVAHAFKSTNHFVQVVWREGNDQKEVWFKVNQNDYSAFLTELERVTGRSVTDLARIRAEILEELEREKGNKIPIGLDRPVWLNGEKLDPGQYQLVLLQREGDGSQLYFFRGEKVEPKHVVAVTTVETLPPRRDTTAGAVLYLESGDSPTTISEVQLLDHSLRFPTAFQLLGPHRVVSREGRPAVQFERGHSGISYASYIDYKGNPAVRFPVIHNHFMWFCVGFLYVTEERVSYEPFFRESPKKRHVFDVLRPHLKEIKSVDVGKNPGISFALPGRTYKFTPVFVPGGPHAPHETNRRILGESVQFLAPHLPEEEIPDEEIREGISDSLDFLLLAVHNFDAVEEEFRQVLASQ
jgi:hypothetical protein